LGVPSEFQVTLFSNMRGDKKESKEKLTSGPRCGVNHHKRLGMRCLHGRPIEQISAGPAVVFDATYIPDLVTGGAQEESIVAGL
jgi:hypothetical protein